MSQLFPKWTNRLPAIATVLIVLGAPALVAFVWYYGSPKNTDVGYAPDQPVPYSHKLHAGLFGMDCRYCHTGVEQGPHAAVPPAATCMNCHAAGVKTDSLALKPIRDSFTRGKPVEWVKVHLLPDYAYFDHSVHVAAGVGCVSCHGRVDQMEVVRQTEPLSMGWCLDCHRNPEKHIRPADQVTNMAYVHDETLAKELIEAKNIKPPEHCGACHR